LDWTGKFQSVADALAKLDLKDVLLDGEVAVAQASGKTDFSTLQKSLESGVAKGELKFGLAGERLMGEFHMVKIKPRDGERGNPWLLFKSKDAFAGKEDPVARNVTSVISGRTIEDVRSGGARVWSKGGERAPKAAIPPKWAFVEPMLATRAEKAPASDAWIHEIKSWTGPASFSRSRMR